VFDSAFYVVYGKICLGLFAKRSSLVNFIYTLKNAGLLVLTQFWVKYGQTQSLGYIFKLHF